MSSTDLGGDPKEDLFYKQVTDGGGTSRGPSNLSDSEVSLWAKLTGRQILALSPALGVPFGVQVPPKHSKKSERRMFWLIPACPHSFFGLEAEGARAEL